MNETNPVSFFQEKVHEAQKRQGVLLSEDLEFYLVNLLCHFIYQSEFSKNCLALIFKQAIESEDKEDRALLFKELGDTALYFSGFFQESFQRKTYDLSYYISMGSGAYLQLSNVTPHKNLSQTYQKIGEGFVEAMDILTDVSEQTHQRSTLSIYTSWQSSGSNLLRNELFKRGVIPVPHKKTMNS